jgi:hypothetical protein
MNVKLAILGAAGLFLLAAAVVLAAPEATVLERWVTGGGGGHAAAGDYSLDATIGQPITGSGAGAPYQLSSGFWAAAWPEGMTYVPLVQRDS